MIKTQTIRKLANILYEFSSKLRGEPYHEHSRIFILLSVRIQSISDKLDEIAYYKEQENK